MILLPLLSEELVFDAYDTLLDDFGTLINVSLGDLPALFFHVYLVLRDNTLLVEFVPALKDQERGEKRQLGDMVGVLLDLLRQDLG